jgi:hypothetical protein
MHSMFIELGRAVSQSHPVLVGIGIAAFSASATFASWRSWRNLSRARTIEDHPTSKARSAHQGYIELEGMGRHIDGPPIVAPLSGLPCVWYRYRIEELITSYNRGRVQRRWTTLERGESNDIFYLEDETGRVVVDPEGAEILPRHKDVWRSRPGLIGFARRPAYIVKFIASRPSGHNYRFTEERINTGDNIYALGLLKNVRSHAGAPAIDEDVRSLLREWKRDQGTLKQRFDLNRDGKLDQREWMLARRQARREVVKARREETMQFLEGINVLTRTEDSKRPYLLSAFSQTALVRRYRTWALAYGAGFFLFGITALWLFNIRFGS